MNRFILAIDQGTSGTKSLIFDQNGQAVAKGAAPLETQYYGDGFVEQDPERIYENVLRSVENCLADLKTKGLNQADISAVGISNQRETFVLWDDNGKPLYNAVVWQCKRSIPVCAELKKRGLSERIRETTGLIIDPYFSATKLIWLNEHVENISSAIKNGRALFGTIDTWLLYKLTNGAIFATDHTNASRTLFLNISSLSWDESLLADFGLTGLRLPDIHPSAHTYGHTTLNGLLQSPVPVAAMIGDSHAAAFGEGCFNRGEAKVTLGTGSSILMNIGEKPLSSRNGMVTTVCWSMEGYVSFAFEGVIVSCGATIEWLKNALSLFEDSSQTEQMALSVNDNGGVYLIPAFSGMGSPHWQMDRRAEITGLSFGSTRNHIVRAALESIPFQVKDVVAAMEADAGIPLNVLKANGGISANSFVMQFMADLLGKEVSSKGFTDVSALGAALLAGLNVGMFESVGTIATIPYTGRGFNPNETARAAGYYQEWLKQMGRYKSME